MEEPIFRLEDHCSFLFSNAWLQQIRQYAISDFQTWGSLFILVSQRAASTNTPVRSLDCLTLLVCFLFDFFCFRFRRIGSWRITESERKKAKGWLKTGFRKKEILG